MSYDGFFELIGPDSYLVQPVLRNHPFLAAFTCHLATVRLYLLRVDDDVCFPFATLKMPGAGHVADNFWRPGNLACDVDPANGKIRTVTTKSLFGTTNHTDHPATGKPLVGKILPMWDRVLDLSRNVSSVFAPVRYQSMDIAIGPDGPLLVEINTGGAFNLPQLASNRGFLTDEVLGFLRGHGWKG